MAPGVAGMVQILVFAQEEIQGRDTGEQEREVYPQPKYMLKAQVQANSGKSELQSTGFKEVFFCGLEAEGMESGEWIH